MFSMTTSAFSASCIRISRPSSVFRFSVMARLLRCRFWKSEPSRRPSISSGSPSPGGGSTRITSAPQSASVRTQEGPARASVRSITLNRDSGSRKACDCGVVLAVTSTDLSMLIVLYRNDVRGIDFEPDFLADGKDVQRRRQDAQLEIAGLGLKHVIPGLAEKRAL